MELSIDVRKRIYLHIATSRTSFNVVLKRLDLALRKNGKNYSYFASILFFVCHMLFFNGFFFRVFFSHSYFTIEETRIGWSYLERIIICIKFCFTQIQNCCLNCC